VVVICGSDFHTPSGGFSLIYTDRLKIRLAELADGSPTMGALAAKALEYTHSDITAILYSCHPQDQLLDFSYKLVDEAVKLDIKKGLHISCRKGCNHCCSQPVATTKMEMNKILSNHTIDPKHKPILEKQAKAESFMDLEREEQNCIFLTPEGCSIYNSRPFHCRLVHSRSLQHCISERETLPAIIDYAELTYSAFLEVLKWRGLLKAGPENVLHLHALEHLNSLK